MLRDHRMQLVEYPAYRPFETQYDRRQDAQTIAYCILLGNHAFQLLTEKFEGHSLSAHSRNMAATRYRINRQTPGFPDRAAHPAQGAKSSTPHPLKSVRLRVASARSSAQMGV
jgi:hypothetical protein